MRPTTTSLRCFLLFALAMLGNAVPASAEPASTEVMSVAAASATRGLPTVAGSWREELRRLPGGGGASATLRLEDERGRCLLDWDSDRATVPASTLKVVTAAAIVEQDGLGRKLRTRLQLRGARLRWVGDYDPELTSAQLEALALELLPRLPKKVQVEVNLPDPEPYPAGWSWDDLSSSFAPALSSLVFDGGVVPLKVRAGSGTPGLQVAAPLWAPASNLSALPSAGDFQVLMIPGWEGWVMAGQVPAGTEEALTVPMPRPESAAARLLAEVLTRRGLEVQVVAPDAELSTGSEALEAFHESRPVGEMLQLGLAESNNLTLECLYRKFGRSRPACLKERSDLRIADGCGLSRYNLVTAHQLTAVLQSCPGVIPLLPLAAREGTLKRRFAGTPLAGQMNAKTGTMSGVSGLVGQFTSSRGERLRFALLLSGFVGSARPFKEAEDQLVTELARSL